MFECTLVESPDRRTGSKRAMTLPVSIAVHASVAAILLGASVWFVEDAPEPVIPVVFYAVSPIPAPSAGGGTPEIRPARRSVRAPTAQPLRLTAIPDEIPAHSVRDERSLGSSPAGDDPASGVRSDPSLGVGDGSPGADGAGPGGPRPSTGAEELLRPGGDVRAPLLQSRVEPLYPEAARRGRMEGAVILEATITAAGSVENVTVLKSANALLDASAVEAVRQWKYKPATLNERAVRVYLTVTVFFHLHD